MRPLHQILLFFRNNSLAVLKLQTALLTDIKIIFCILTELLIVKLPV